MKEEIEANKTNILIVFIYTVGLTVFTLYHCYQHDNRLNEHKERLNEHKRLLIAQQEQINQLILNAHKYEKKVK